MMHFSAFRHFLNALPYSGVISIEVTWAYFLHQIKRDVALKKAI